MSVSAELNQLADLHQRGVLTDEEFARAKARLLDGASVPPGAPPHAINGLRRSLGDRWIGGVCGGIAQATGLASWVWRLIFTLAMVFAGTGLLLYVLLWIFVPQEPMYLPPGARPNAG
jgi:phage shock protein PspC (stress-responsive transcriptional regulator)